MPCLVISKKKIKMLVAIIKFYFIIYTNDERKGTP